MLFTSLFVFCRLFSSGFDVKVNFLTKQTQVVVWHNLKFMSRLLFSCPLFVYVSTYVSCAFFCARRVSSSLMWFIVAFLFFVNVCSDLGLALSFLAHVWFLFGCIYTCIVHVWLTVQFLFVSCLTSYLVFLTVSCKLWYWVFCLIRDPLFRFLVRAFLLCVSVLYVCLSSAVSWMLACPCARQIDSTDSFAAVNPSTLSGDGFIGLNQKFCIILIPFNIIIIIWPVSIAFITVSTPFRTTNENKVHFWPWIN